MVVRNRLNINKGRKRKGDTVKAKKSSNAQTVVTSWNVMMAITPKTQALEKVAKESLAMSVKEIAQRL